MLDTHVHFFDPDWPGRISWPDPSKSFYGRRLPDDYRNHQGIDCPREVIAVETSPHARDDENLRHVANASTLIAGYIANLQPGEAEFEKRLTRFREDPKFKGIRLRPIEQFDLNEKALIEALATMSETGLTLELGAKTTERLANITALATTLPEVTFVVTHGGHPKISEHGPAAPWAEAMTKLAKLPNVYLKITPLRPFICMSDAHHLSDEQILDVCAPYFLVYASAFGDDRLILGSNWPVSEQVSSFSAHKKLALRGLQSQFKVDPFRLEQAGRRLYGLNGSGGS